MSQELIVNWLNRVSETITQRDLDAHMALVSKQVKVYGIPGQALIDYRGWKKRRQYELEHDKLAGLEYRDLRIKTITLRRLGFEVTESMHGKNGRHIMIHKDVMLEQERDNEWRVVEETVRDWTLVER
ncbi:MAG: hypothetical protein LJE74_10815 [Proteobacteria bacterium]|jgi:hypothetical protein|nr:hypothetical protein [Pseudomonadota bacterium]